MKLRRRRRRYPFYPGLGVKVFLAGAAIYGAMCVLPLPEFVWFHRAVGVTGEHRSGYVTVTPFGVELVAGWGWSSREWMENHSGSGERWHVGNDFFGFLVRYGEVAYYALHPIRLHFVALGVPWWFLAALVFSRELTRWEHRRRVAKRALRRKDRSRCAWCGYDLRASPERCPECGRGVWGKLGSRKFSGSGNGE